MRKALSITIASLLIVFIITGLVLGIAARANPDFLGGAFVANEQVQDETVIGENISILEVDFTNCDVTIKSSEDDLVKIEYQKRENCNYNTRIQNGKLVFTEKRTFSLKMLFGFPMVKTKATVYVPSIREIDVKTSNAMIDIFGIFVDDIEAETSNNFIYASLLTASDVSLKTSNDEINMYDSKITELSMKTSNGTIVCENCEFDDVEIETSNERVYVTDVLTNDISIDNSNGSINILNLTSRKAKLETSNDIINVSTSKISILEAVSSNKNINIDLIGDINDYTYTLDSRSKVLVNNLEVKKGTYNKGKNNSIKIKTSGNIALQINQK